MSLKFYVSKITCPDNVWLNRTKINDLIFPFSFKFTIIFRFFRRFWLLSIWLYVKFFHYSQDPLFIQRELKRYALVSIRRINTQHNEYLLLYFLIEIFSFCFVIQGRS